MLRTGLLRAALASAAAVAALAACPGRAAAQQEVATPANDCPAGNLVAGKRPAQWSDVRGSTVLVTDGNVVPEGSIWNASPAIVFDTAAGSVSYDLGAPTPVRAVYVQADANDTYGVFGSMDGHDWKRLGEIPTADGHGLRGRTLRFDEGGGTPERVRFIRVGEGQGDNFYSLSELQVFCQVPSPFPPVMTVVEAPAAPKGPPPRWWRDETSARFELVLAVLGLALLLWGWRLEHDGRGKHLRQLRDGLLAFLGLVAAATYVNFGAFHFNNFVHTWDTYHYYIGAKYFRELEYDRLYECSAVADYESGLKRRVELRKVTNLRTNVLETTDIWKHPDDCKRHFTPARWDSFKHDVAWFRNALGAKRWDESQTDHGYNGSPVWNVAGSLLANLGPITDRQVVALDSIDCGLMVGFAGLIWWAFGWRVLAVGLLVYGTNFPSRWYWTGGSLLRYDWLFWMVAGICFIKKERNLLGGFALAYSALLRLFPAFLFVGPMLLGIQQLRQARRLSLRALDPRLLSIFGGAALAFAVLIPASLVTGGGSQAYVRFYQNSKKHAETPLTNYMGLRTLVAYRPAEVGSHLRSDKLQDPWSAWKTARLRAWKAPASRLAYLLCLAGFGWLLWRALRGVDPWLAVALGATSIAVAPSELTCYYYSFLVAVALAQQRRPEVGIYLLAVTAMTQFMAWAPIPGMATWTDEQYTEMSVATLAGFVAILWAFGGKTAGAPAASAAAGEAPAAPVAGAGAPPSSQGDGAQADPGRKKRHRRR